MKIPTWALDAVSELPGLVNKEQAAKFLNITERTIATMCISGDLKHVRRCEKGSSKIMIPRQWIAEYLVSIQRGKL